MEAVGTLVGGIAHDFNNMLAGITGNLYLAKSLAGALPDVLQKLDNVEKISFRAADMIQQLLTFSRKDSVSMKPMPFPVFIKETLKFIRSSIPENIQIEQSVCADSLMVLGDATQIHQIMLNLVNNARDAVASVQTPRITISLDAFDVEGDFLKTHPHFKPGRYAHLQVQDNGSGISEAHLEHLFEPFFTTKEVGKGTGLGLSMVFGAVKNHQGFVEVASAEGSGSTFHLYLPLLESADNTAALSLPEAEVRGADELILFVDDEQQIVEVTKELLEYLGYRVIVAYNGQEAIKAFAAHQDEIALVITDVVMPELGGVEAVGEIKRMKPDIKVIFSSGYDKLGYLQHHLPEGSMSISKPYNVIELSKIIKDMLHT